MQRFLLRLSVILMTAFVSVCTVHAQEIPDTSKPTSIDPKLLDWVNARLPKEYTIANINITGIKHLDTSIVYSIANLQPGDKFMHPGEDILQNPLRISGDKNFFPMYRYMLPSRRQ
jgi:outer membrane protein insertion porin family